MPAPIQSSAGAAEMFANGAIATVPRLSPARSVQRPEPAASCASAAAGTAAASQTAAPASARQLVAKPRVAPRRAGRPADKA